jgi:rhodanese-related sulfurtransferase
MDGILPLELYDQLGGAASPALIDIRQSPADGRLIVSATRRSAADVIGRTAEALAPPRTVLYGDEDDAAARLADTLRRAGGDAVHLAGGYPAWRAAGLPTRRTVGATRKWVTRERPKIDRIACPWLIRRFIDPGAEFIYVPTSQVLGTARETGAIPYDIEGVEFAHEGERCSFDTILRIFDIHDAALDHVATIVRGADTSRHDLAPPCAGLFAISLGLSANFPDDHAMLAHGMVMYDALHTWCRKLQHETHNWPATQRRAAS